MPREGKLPDETPTEEPDEERDPRGTLTTAFLVNGKRYELWTGRIKPIDELALYNETGLQLPRILAEINEGNGSPMFVGCLVFMVLRSENEPVTFAEAQALVGWDAKINVRAPAEPDEAPLDPAND